MSFRSDQVIQWMSAGGIRRQGRLLTWFGGPQNGFRLCVRADAPAGHVGELVSLITHEAHPQPWHIKEVQHVAARSAS
ncbi:hypothetical protein [Nitrospirillum viridazoti]|uniref:Uncharacterized protein n=1 Tax=Nitrospirillum amazonense TaxID=28077 RepID=A0A560II37_9PROT|nr:hypothetical protein [Nitrospirillum amazonense]TWB58712.1 hypothetical protein FBZ92_109205 [Nitrospirillum amazonense]